MVELLEVTTSNPGPSQLDFRKNGNLKSSLENIVEAWGALTEKADVTCRALKLVLQKPNAMWTQQHVVKDICT